MMLFKFGRWFSFVATVLSMTLLMTSIGAEGQIRTASRQPQDRGVFVDGVVRDLVDSQMNFHSVPLEPLPSGAANVETRQAVQELQKFSQHADRLVSALRYEERYSPAIRPLLADMLRIKAYSDALVRQAQGSADPRQVIADYAELDRTWRLVAHQLQQTSGMGQSVLQWVTALNQVNDRVGQMLKLDPQLERSDLVYAIVALRSDLDHLDEDIAVDLFGHPDQAQLSQAVRVLRSRAQQLQLAAENRYPYDYLKTNYQNFFKQWKQVKLKLRGIDNRYVQRHVSRITTINEKLHELLWLPPVVDGNEILYLADTLKSNVDHVSDQITMRQLMSIPNADRIFSRATDFYELCDQFRQSVARETQFDNVRWDFQELDVAWNDLRTVLLPLNSPDTNQHVAFIDQSVMGLRTALGLHSQINRDEALQVVATLNNMADLLNYDLTQSIGQSSQYPSQFRSQAVDSSRSLRQSVRSLYDGVARNANKDQLRTSMQKLASDWNRLMQVVNRIREEDRMTIARTVHQISPAVAKLQVMFAY